MIHYVECECIIHDSHSLKEKRAVLQRVLTRLKQKLNVSVSEIDHQDVWQRTRIGIVAVASSLKAAEKEIDNALKVIDSFPEWERGETVHETR
ncbi:uncharacterized protein YlxP (DUF503 family) [Bacillus pakistanensis]|uniref:Uncharacterized protein YlxP (DUF503 family) n=1 Tax=Rossellomorea pakistanensis TaxID=992288 RepID=A0ABS2NG91_9BACI|nr:DUF503 family protein [Bacillus pakistanensis]MBM7586875.1 uncharacterized protein YlxP (DUF503 family) [Bacillus pakistanensis]